MKKLLFFILFSFIIVISYGQGVSVGLKAGLNIANQRYFLNGYSANGTVIPGFHAGVYAVLMPNKHFGLQPEILYSSQGSRLVANNVKLNYVIIPILLRYNVNKFLSFHAGPQAGFLLSTKDDYDDVSGDKYKSTDVGLAVGGIIDLPIGLNFTFRYIAGIKNINGDGDPDYKIKNHNVQLSFGYKLFGTK